MTLKVNEGDAGEIDASGRRWVTARDLTRNSSDLLDRVEWKGETLVVSRNGHAVALLGPFQHEDFYCDWKYVNTCR